MAAPIASFEANLTTPASNNVTLNSTASPIFTDPNVPGTLVEFDTSKGDILVSLTDAATPLTVANFLSFSRSNLATSLTRKGWPLTVTNSPSCSSDCPTLPILS